MARPSDSLTGDPEALRARLDEDGYLFVPGVLDREAVRAGRLELLARVQAAGALDASYPLEDGVLRPGADEFGLWQSYPSTSETLMSVLRGERMLSLFAGILGGEVRAYDFVWLRDQPREPRRQAALRHRLHGPRHTPGADVLDAVRGHPARRRRAHAARELPPHGRRARRRLPPPGRRQLLQQRPERRRRARRHDAVGALGAPAPGREWERRARRGCRRAARGVGRALADRAGVPDGGRADLHHGHGPCGHRQRDRHGCGCRPTAVTSARTRPSTSGGCRRERRGAGRPRRRREAGKIC